MQGKSLRSLGRSKIWGRGYTTIPVTVRKYMDLTNGDHIEWYVDERGRIIVDKSPGGRR